MALNFQLPTDVGLEYSSLNDVAVLNSVFPEYLPKLLLQNYNNEKISNDSKLIQVINIS